MDRDIVVRNIDEIISDPTYRLDVTYWKDFAIDFNKNSLFLPRKLGGFGELRYETIEQQPLIKEIYYNFKIKYTGEVVLKEPIDTENLDINKFKVAKTGDLVFSRINCCRGSIGT